MRVSKWTPNFRPNMDCPIIPIWITLEGLPIHFFKKEALFPIANLIGNPLKVDAATSTRCRPSTARVCVELDLSKDLEPRIWIDDCYGVFSSTFYMKTCRIIVCHAVGWGIKHNLVFRCIIIQRTS